MPLVDILPKGIVVAEYAANNQNTAVTIRDKKKIINHTARMDKTYSGCIIFNDFNETEFYMSFKNNNSGNCIPIVRNDADIQSTTMYL